MVNWLGTEWFTQELFAKNLSLQVLRIKLLTSYNLNVQVIAPRKPWTYQADTMYQPTVAGFVRKYDKNVDVLTVKGSGHFVPLDR